MSKRNWTKKEKEYIIKQYLEEGKNLEQIGKEFCAKADTISKYLKSWGIEIKPKGCCKNRKVNHNFFSSIDTPEKAYFLGLLFTDGSVTLDKQRSPNIAIELVETDIDILDKFKQTIGSNSKFSYNKRDNRKQGTYTFSIRSKQFAEDLAKYNIVPNKTYTVDEIIIPNFEKDFLRGFIDGDGSIYYSDGSWHINVCGHSQNIIKQISQLGDCLIGATQNKIQVSDGVYRYSWNGYKAIQLCELLYDENTFYTIERKKQKALEAIASKKN